MPDEDMPPLDLDEPTPQPGAEPVVARQAEFPQLGHDAPTGRLSLDSFQDVPITITARLGHAVLPIADILKLGPGAVVELDERIDQPIELTVRGVPFATGEVVVVDHHFAIRILSLTPTRSGRADQ